MMSYRVRELLWRAINGGKLDAASTVDVLNDAEVVIVNLRTIRQHRGNGRDFLLALKRLGLRIHVEHPTRDALPFWRKMWREGLIEDDPDRLTTWETFSNGLECQMGADKSFLAAETPSDAKKAAS